MLAQGKRRQRGFTEQDFKIAYACGIEASNSTPKVGSIFSQQCFSSIASRLFYGLVYMQYVHQLSLSTQSQCLGITGFAQQETAKNINLSIKLDLQEFFMIKLQPMSHEGSLTLLHRQPGQDYHVGYQKHAC